MALTLGTIIADFETQLATQIDVSGTTATLQSATDDDGVALPTGLYFLAIDKDNSQKEFFSCTLTGTSLTNIKSISRQGVETTGAVRKHRVGASVTLTDFANIKILGDLLTGALKISPTTPLAYSSQPTLNNDDQLATKKYVDDNIGPGGGDVIGPPTSVDNGVPRFDGTGGTDIQGSGVSILDTAHAYQAQLDPSDIDSSNKAFKFPNAAGTFSVIRSVSSTCTVSTNDLIANFDLTTILEGSTDALIVLGRAALHSANFNTETIIGRASAGSTPTGNTSIVLSNGESIAFSKFLGNTPTGITVSMTSNTNLRVTFTYGSTPGAPGACDLKIIILK